jgi:lysyl-tRNA synthetase class 2
LSGPELRSASACAACGRETGALRDGLCIACWYAAPERPKPVRDRFAKLQKLRELGVEPYAYSFAPSHSLTEAMGLYRDEDGHAGTPVRVAGRILSLRDLGGSAFAHLGDRSGRLQAYFKRDVLGPEDRQLLELLDLGDWIGVEGPLFRTRTGEVTVRAERLLLLSKSLRPLPLGKEEVTEAGERIVHSGFSNVESRYRQRYADLAVNPEVREVFATRARVVTELRTFLDARGFLEVETPVLQPLYGGAAARPFTTYHNTLDTELYLRIADELYLKRLIVGNLDRVYEIGKNFRNEGIDRTHNPEFTMLELYQAYADYEDMMELSEELVTSVAQKINGTLTVEYDREGLDFGRPWRRLTMREAIREFAGIDIEEASDADLLEAARELGRADADQLNRAKLIDVVFSARVEEQLTSPTIIYDYPIEMSPLAKPKRGAPHLAERFEVIAGRAELVNAFSELNDPIDQFARFSEQARLRAAGDLEAAPEVDEDYVRALEYGLPPTGGLGLGVDRLIMLLTGRTTIREVVLYPQLRAEEGH